MLQERRDREWEDYFVALRAEHDHLTRLVFDMITEENLNRIWNLRKEGLDYNNLSIRLPEATGREVPFSKLASTNRYYLEVLSDIDYDIKLYSGAFVASSAQIARALEATKGDVEAAARLVAQGPLIDAMDRGAPMGDIQKLIDEYDPNEEDEQYGLTSREYVEMLMRETEDRAYTPMSPVERRALRMEYGRQQQILEAMDRRR